MASGAQGDDGIVHVRGERRRWPALAAALLLALFGLAGYWLLLPDAAPAEPQPRAAERADPALRAMEQALANVPPEPAANKPAPRAPDAQPAGDRLATPAEILALTGGATYVDQLDAGDGKGIYAFPKPGTKQLKSGLLVPDGYRLPPGYIRHYQTTDDGEQLQPILMFHPDYQPPPGVTVPADRVVTPELAPPDLPQTWMEAPPVRRDRPPQ